MKNNTLVTLLLSVFIALLGMGIIVPVMPVFAAELGAGGLGLGMIIGVFSISRGLLQPVVGSLSDRWGRKHFLVAGLLIYGLVGLLIPQAKNIFHLIVIRAFHGVGSAMIVPIGMAYMSLLSPPGHEGRYMSYLNIAIFCGIGCGPIVGGLFSDLFGFFSVFYLMAGMSFLAFFLVIINMPRYTRGEGRKTVALLKSVSVMVRSKRTLGILVARYGTMIVMVPTMAFLPLLMSEWPTHTGLQVGFVIAARTLVNALLQLPFGRLADKYDKTLLLLIGIFCMTLAIVTVPSVKNFYLMVILYMLLGCGEAIIWPALGAYASEEGKRLYGHGTMMGVFSFAMSGGVLTGAVLAGTAMDMLGIRWAFYICAAAVLILTVLAVWMIRSGERKDLMVTA